MQEGRKRVEEGRERKGEEGGREGGRKGTAQHRDIGGSHETAVHRQCGKTREGEVVSLLPQERSPTGENWMTPRALKSRVPSRDFGHMGAEESRIDENEEDGLSKANAVNEVDAERDCVEEEEEKDVSFKAKAVKEVDAERDPCLGDDFR
jgi:hypothetical protein